MQHAIHLIAIKGESGTVRFIPETHPLTEDVQVVGVFPNPNAFYEAMIGAFPRRTRNQLLGTMVEKLKMSADVVPGENRNELIDTYIRTQISNGPTFICLSNA